MEIIYSKKMMTKVIYYIKNKEFYIFTNNVMSPNQDYQQIEFILNSKKTNY